jgi:hypothetical protein
VRRNNGQLTESIQIGADAHVIEARDRSDVRDLRHKRFKGLAFAR